MPARSGHSWRDDGMNAPWVEKSNTTRIQYLVCGYYDRVPWRGGLVKSDEPCPSCNLDFGELFYREPVLPGCAYFCAPPTVVYEELAERFSTTRTSSAADHDLEVASLAAGDAVRLEEWIYQANAQGLFEWSGSRKVWPESVPMCVCVISQNFAFQKTFGINEIPSLLPRGIYFDIRRHRSLTACEEWCCHGFPHLAVPELEPFAKHFPIPSLVRTGKGAGSGSDEAPFTLSEQKVLIGNGMHVAQIGLWFLFDQLGFTNCVLEPPLSSEF